MYAYVLVVISLVVTGSRSAERLPTDLDRNEHFLPFLSERTIVHQWSADRKRIGVSGRVVRAVDAVHDTGLFATAYNPIVGEDLPAQVGVRQFPGGRLIRDIPIWLTITDLVVYSDSAPDFQAVMALGYRNDSTYAVRVYPDGITGAMIFLGTGNDSTGDGKWNPNVIWVSTYERDRRTLEAFIYVGASRDGGVRKLVCLDLPEQRIKWSLPVAGSVPPGELRHCCWEGQRYTVFTTGSPSQGRRDTLFSDQYGYFVSVDTTGRVRYAAIVKSFLTGAFLTQLDSTSVYCSFDYPFISVNESPDTVKPSPRIARVTPNGVTQCVIDAGGKIDALWPGRYKGQPVIFVQQAFQRLQVYDSSLHLLAESDSTNRLNKSISLINGLTDSLPMLFLPTESGGFVISAGLEKLFSISAPGMTLCQPIAFGEDGRVTAFLASGGNEVVVATVTPSSLWHAVEVLYVDHRGMFLSILVGLTVLLGVVNAFRSRNRRTLLVVANQKKELEAAHAALKEAQAKLVATEKYRQAKDIAGGFAHEIRNALFPAEAALVKLRSTVNPAADQDDKVGRYLSGASQAVSRAINATRLISQYTKLDTQYLPERVVVTEVVDEVLKANELRLSELNLSPTVEGHPAIAVACNKEQLATAVNNLVTNALDAVRGSSDGRLVMAWRSTSTFVTIDISDNGPGVPVESKNRIFDTFYSTKPSTGTGLGLPIARKIVELYGGTLTYRRASDLTIFTITLPADGERRTKDTIP